MFGMNVNVKIWLTFSDRLLEQITSKLKCKINIFIQLTKHEQLNTIKIILVEDIHEYILNCYIYWTPFLTSRGNIGKKAVIFLYYENGK